jgi:sarcosine oxidase subunit beta
VSARPDVVVVGAGIVGLSIAFHLREGGATVKLLEGEDVGAGASGVQPGGVRQQWGTSANCLPVQESMRASNGSAT